MQAQAPAGASKPSAPPALTALAESLFNDSEFSDLCQKGLTQQLKRTKDGATADTRITELAGLVKLLRRCFSQLSTRTRLFLEAGLSHEREAAQQLETVRLACESTLAEQRLLLARAKQDSAEAQAEHVRALAAQSSGLEWHKTEVSRLVREVERLQSEGHLASCREGDLKSEESRAIKGLQEESSRLRKECESWQRQAKEEEAAHEDCEEQLSSARSRTFDLERAVEAAEQAREAASREAQQLGEQVAALQRDISQAAALAAGQEQRTAAILEQLGESRRRGEGQQQALLDLQAAAAASHAREEQLMAEKAALKGALATALAAAQEHAELRDALEGRLQAAESQQEALSTELTACQAHLAASREETARAQAACKKLEEADQQMRASLARSECALGALQDAVGTGSVDHAEMLSRLVGRVSSLEAALATCTAQRRALHNEVLSLRGNVRVFCRVRPSPASVVSVGQEGAVSLASEGKEHAFTFDWAFGPDSTQAQVYAQCSELVQSALDGYKVCIFSYGQTGAGKTHTMQGSSSGGGEEGITPRAVQQLLAAVEQLREQGWVYQLQASFIEVYNDGLRDLLAPKKSAKLPDNAVKHSANGDTTVLGCTYVALTDAAAAARLVKQAASARACEATACNATSSRSHAVMCLSVSGTHAASGTRLSGALNLVDLAGSERLAKSGAEGARAKEAVAINKSLSSLADVFAALGTKSAHVNYRGSKLTWLLQGSLGGDGKTLMVVNVNPAPEFAQESLCSLRFASKVNACETAARGGARRHVQQQAGVAAPGGSSGGSAASLRDASNNNISKPGALKRRAPTPVEGAPASKRRL